MRETGKSKAKTIAARWITSSAESERESLLRFRMIARIAAMDALIIASGNLFALIKSLEINLFSILSILFFTQITSSHIGI